MILIQGFGAQMIGWHPGLCSLLASAGFRVIRFDNRDIGMSSHFEDATYSIADMASDVAALIHELGYSDAHIVGQSMGGMIAQELAIQNPEVVRTLALIYTTPNLDFIGNSVDERPNPPEATSAEEAAALHLENERTCASSDYPQDVQFIKEVGARAFARNPRRDGIPRQMQAIKTSRDRSGFLQQVSAPTTILAGTADQLIHYRASERLQQLIPGSDLTIFQGMGHELPEPLWPEITEVLIQNTQRAAAQAADAQHQ